MSGDNGNITKPKSNPFETIMGVFSGVGNLIKQMPSIIAALAGSENQVNVNHAVNTTVEDVSPHFSWTGLFATLSVGPGTSKVTVASNENLTITPGQEPPKLGEE